MTTLISRLSLPETTSMPQNKPNAKHTGQTKVTKVRRTRQPRNPQLSVARRNERERNRVKMVNNGFAMLREHLPVEDLQQAYESEPESAETPNPDGSSSNGKSSKTKKFSKVETLRAAILRIRMLEELIRSTEPNFESMNIVPNPSLGLYDDEPLSVGEPLSCASSAGSTNQMLQVDHNIYGQSADHFVKLEPSLQMPMSAANPLIAATPPTTISSAASLPSPQDSQASPSSGLSQQQQLQQQQQIHHNGLHLGQNYSNLPAAQVHQNNQQQQHHQSENDNTSSVEHTQLWIQQHQNSFIEQQQQHQSHQQVSWYPNNQQQVEQTALHTAEWYSHQLVDHQSPQQPSQYHSFDIQQQQQQIASSPGWLNSTQQSPDTPQLLHSRYQEQPQPQPQHHLGSQTGNSQPNLPTFVPQQHQISLYSQ